MTSHPPGKQCPHLASCELFPKFQKRATLGVWQTFYCLGEYDGCVRYTRALQSLPVSPNLLPNGRELTLAVLGS